MELCSTLNALARETWDHMNFGFRLGYGRPDERAFTDHHLIELCRHHWGPIKAHKFDQNRESETAADFEWWLGDGTSCLAMRVQAKKLDLIDDAYAELANRTSDKAERQIDRLIRVARAERLLPVYLFFNGPPLADAWPSDRCRNLKIESPLRGCTIALASEVRQALDERRRGKALDAQAPLAWPWQCLICCPNAPAHHPGERALDVLGQVTDKLEEEPGARLTDELPEYVRALARAEVPEVEVAHETDSIPGASRVLLMTGSATG